jgi:hypothetical protein
MTETNKEASETWMCGCGGLLTLDRKDDIGTEWFKCDKCNRIESRMELEKNRIKSLEALKVLSDQTEKVTMSFLIDEFSKSFEMTEESKESLKIIFSVYFEQFVDGDPIWLHIIESIGGCKTTIIEILEDCVKSIRANKITPKTLASSKKAKSGRTIGEENLAFIDKKVWLFKDFTTILSQNENDRRAIYGDLRVLHDGEMSFMSGSESGSIVAPCRTTIITGVTETIDRQGYNMQIMGERFTKTRLNLKTKRSEIIHKAMVETGNEETVKKSMQTLFNTFYQKYSYPEVWTKQSEVKLKLLESPYAKKIENLADLITRIRVYCWKDPRYSDSFIEEPLEEHGTRLVKQLTKAAILLTILNEKQSFDEELWSILLKYAEDCCTPIRLKIIKSFKDKKFAELSTEELSDTLKLSRICMKCRLQELEAAHILEAHYEGKSDFYITGWIVQSDIKKLIANIYGCEIPTEQVALTDVQTKLEKILSLPIGIEHSIEQIASLTKIPKEELPKLLDVLIKDSKIQHGSDPSKYVIVRK